MEELLIHHDETSNLLPSAQSISLLFRLGEWKKALRSCKKSAPLPLPDLIQVYQAGCLLSCKIIESQNIRLGIQICKKLNELVIEHDAKHFISYECEVLNYIACAYKQAEKLFLAKKYMEKAMRIVNDYRHEAWDKSASFLNMCAILSAIGKHKEAGGYAKTAIEIAQEELVNVKFTGNHEQTTSKAAVLGIAYHNYAVEEEFMGNSVIALHYYEKAFKIIEKNAPDNRELIEKFKKNFVDLKKIQVKPSRPSSAKVAKGQLLGKPPNELFATGNKKVLKRGSQKMNKFTKSSKDIKEDEVEKEFAVFKNQCKEFLSSNKEWFKAEVPVAAVKNFEVVKREKMQRTRPVTTNSNKFDLFEMKTESALTINAPVKGVENKRKPVLYEITLKPEKAQSKPEESQAESAKSPEEIQKFRSQTKKFSQISKGSSHQNYFETRPKESVQVFEDFDIISSPQSENPQEVSERPSEVKEPSQVSLKDNIKQLNILISRLQARFRGRLAREKFMLLLKKTSILYRKAKKINGLLHMITLISKNNSVFAVINDGKEDQKLKISEKISPAEIVERLEKNESGFYLKKNEEKEKADIIKNIRVRISNEECEVKYLYMEKSQKLIVKATKYSNSRVYTLERPVWFNSRALLIRFIHDEIHPYLDIIGHNLVINKDSIIIERHFLAKGTRILQSQEFVITVSRVINDQGISIEYIAECAGIPKLKKMFLQEQVLESLSMFAIKDIEDEPHFALLPLHIQENSLTLRKLEKRMAECIYEEKNVLDSSPYTVKVVKIHDESVTYFIAAFNNKSPAVTSFSITDKDLASIYKTQSKKIKQNIAVIMKTLMIKDGKLFLTPVLIHSQSMKTHNLASVIKIQAFIRGHLSRDKNKLFQSKTPLLIRTSKSFEDFEVLVNVYRVDSCFIFEILNQFLEKSDYLLVTRPQIYFKRCSRFFDIKCIVNSISFEKNLFKLASTKGDLDFNPCKFYSNIELCEDLPWLLVKQDPGDEYAILARELLNKSLLVKIIPQRSPICQFRIFSALEVAEHKIAGLLKLIRYHSGDILLSDLLEISPSPAKLEENIFFRTCKQISGRLYQVIMSLTEEKNENDQKMVFTLRQGSLASLSKTLEINVEEACAKTGFTKGYLIPMADYIIRHLLYIDEDKVCLDFSKGAFDINKAILKIQAMVRGHFTRTKILQKVNMVCLARCKVRLYEQGYTVILARVNEDFKIYAINGLKILSSFIDKRHIEENHQQLDKLLQSKIIVKLSIGKDKQGKEKLKGLQEYKRFIRKKSVKNSTSRSHIFSPQSTGNIGSLLMNSKGKETGRKDLKWRAPRTINSEKCLVSVYELEQIGLIEVIVISKDLTLSLEVTRDQIENPEILTGHLDIQNDVLLLKILTPNIVYADKRFISNRFVELSVFVTEKGYFATVFMPEENKSLNAFLGVDVDPSEISRSLKIEEIMGQDVLLVSR